jgi:isopenicillin-N epimerase
VALRDAFLLDDGTVYLNHGAFGACPAPVFREYQRWQRDLERNPVDLLGRRLEGLLQSVRAELAATLGADVEGLVLVPNPTAGVNVAARSIPLEAGDEVVATDHEYGAMAIVWRDACRRAEATYVPRPVELPCQSADGMVEAIWGGVTARTRVLFVSHISSPTAVRFPVEELCARARAAGIVSVVDGAHAPGQLDVDLGALQPDYYTGTCHKWLCAPRGTGFLVVGEEHREELRPHAVSWLAEAPEFAARHWWYGTGDPSPYLAVPAALEFHREQLAPRRQDCHALLEELRPRLGRPLTPAGAEWFGQMAAVELPPCEPDEVARRLRDEHAIEVVVHEWNGRPLLRVSVQAYNTVDDLQMLEAALATVLG